MARKTEEIKLVETPELCLHSRKNQHCSHVDGIVHNLAPGEIEWKYCCWCGGRWEEKVKPEEPKAPEPGHGSFLK